MFTRSKTVEILLPPETLEEARGKATAAGRTLSSFLRRLALHAPAERPKRMRIVGVEEMEVAGVELGRAVRGEHGRSRQDIPVCMMRLHAKMQALRLEETEEPMAVPATFWRRESADAEEDCVPKDRLRRVVFRCTDCELETMRANASAFGLPLSTYVRRRLQGYPLRPRRLPVEGLSVVVKTVALMRHAAGFREAGPGAVAFARQADAVRWALEREGRA
ncbi:MAG: hypothetical protein K6E40_03665 [Desulfovibrio sp.]|nr:hypothetical protein [Desulfovibrio sp.]